MAFMRDIRWHHLNRVALLGLSISIAACGSDHDGGPDSGNNGLIVYPNPVVPPKPRSLSQVLPNAYRTPKDVGVIPEQFRGRWAAIASDCASAVKRLTVKRREIEAGAARRAVGEVVALSPTKIRLAPKSSGSGDERWRMTLLHDGKTLLVARSSPESMKRYQRCPA